MGAERGSITGLSKLLRSWDHAPSLAGKKATKIMEIMGEKVPHYVLKNRSWVSLAAHMLVYK